MTATSSLKSHGMVLLELYGKLIYPTEPPRTDLCPHNYTLTAKYTRHDGYFVRFRWSREWNPTYFEEVFLLVHNTQHGGFLRHVASGGLLIRAVNPNEVSPISELSIRPTPDEVIRLEGEDQKVFQEVLETLRLIQSS